MTRQRLVVANWKQNTLTAAATSWIRAVEAGLDNVPLPAGLSVAAAPSYVALAACRAALAGRLTLMAQNVAAQDSGAFTGEVGPGMLIDVGIHAAIVGHSERRSLFHEDDDLVGRKVASALSAGLSVVLCVGEPLAAREAETHEAFVLGQLEAALAGIDVSAADARLVIAYEPVWAIGTGRTAQPEQANEMHGAIRTFLSNRFGAAGRDRSILYGGSVKPLNAAQLIAQPEIDGFLVGGASLLAEPFLAIVRAVASDGTVSP
ncbi:MAG: triose-phosphate isomerase [Myxococcales bacterium FL481]|nr:MAG: triose-phosphate isomerase [Myxococcales bacterium FL481]